MEASIMIENHQLGIIHNRGMDSHWELNCDLVHRRMLNLVRLEAQNFIYYPRGVISLILCRRNGAY